MDFFYLHKQEAGFLFLRVLTGILFLWQGYDKLFRLGIPRVKETFKQELRKTGLPDWVYQSTATYSSVVEFAGGLCLILGLFTYPMLMLLAVNMLLVIVAHSLIEPLWNMRDVFPRIVLLVLLFFIPAQLNTLSLDYLLGFGYALPILPF